MRLIVANEPRSYREAVAHAIRALRPDVEVHSVRPEELDTEVSRLRPEMVVCSRATERVRREVQVWVELYPGHGSSSRVSVAGRAAAAEGMELPNIVTLVDLSGELAQSG